MFSFVLTFLSFVLPISKRLFRLAIPPFFSIFISLLALIITYLLFFIGILLIASIWLMTDLCRLSALLMEPISQPNFLKFKRLTLLI